MSATRSTRPGLTPGCGAGRKIMKRPVLASIRFYQRWISPLFPPACRFHPTCSQYAYEAIDKYGVLKGGRLATWRLLRCNPYNKGGFDYVP
jgi:putative membrane protein insertion efficiency factor